MSEPRTVVADLGWCVGRLHINEDGLAQSLILISPAETDDNRYAPAESVCISSRQSLLKLLDFLHAHIQDEAPV